MIESELSVPTFSIDSLKDYYYYSEGGNYIFIEDKNNRIHFCTLLGEVMPSTLKEDIYRDKANPQIRYFVYEISENEPDKINRIFMGYPVDDRFLPIIKDYVNSFIYTTPPQIKTPSEYGYDSHRIRFKTKTGDKNKFNGGDTVTYEDGFGRDSIVILTKRPSHRGRFNLR